MEDGIAMDEAIRVPMTFLPLGAEGHGRITKLPVYQMPNGLLFGYDRQSGERYEVEDESELIRLANPIA